MRKLVGFWLVTLSACAPPSAQEQVQAFIGEELHFFLQASNDLRQAAPPVHEDGWQLPRDAQAIAKSRVAWRRARLAYEHIESAIAALFPDEDHAVDGRYDDFAPQQGPRDKLPNLFNGEAMTGMHAVERILWADSVSQAVLTYESALPNYQPPRFPATAREAQDYRDVLVHQLTSDVQLMQVQSQGARLDLAYAFGGVVDSMKEQREKVNLAGEGSDESRYAQHTMADMRANLVGGRAMYEIYRPLLRKRANGRAIDNEVLQAFGYLQNLYTSYPGDSVPQPPAGWSQTPPPEQLATSYGALWQHVRAASDERNPQSLVALLKMAQLELELDEDAP